jgi:hypothetical protein
MVADAVPLVAQEEDFSNPQELQIRGLTTFATSLEEAQARIDGLLREVDQRLRKGDHQGLVDILDDHPQLVAHPWVRQELVKWLATGRSYRKPGRRRGSVYRRALVVAGIVEELIRRGLAENKERAFCWLADHHYMSYDAAKYQYYQAWNDERFKPILFNLAAEPKSVSGQEFFDIHSKAEVLKAGQSITRTLAKLPEGPVTATFFGL